MNIPAAKETTSEERLMAALAHLCILLPGMGIIGPTLVWIYQRGRSAFAVFHALQALTYQAFFFIYATLFGCLAQVLLFIGLIPLAAYAAENPRLGELPFFGVRFLFMGVIFCSYGAYILLGIIGAVLTLSGADFRYPLLGAWVQRYLGKKPLPEADSTPTPELTDEAEETAE